MTRFFDFCNKNKKPISFSFFLLLFLFLLVPLARAGIGGKRVDAPYFVSVFSETWYTSNIFSGYSSAPYYALRIWRNIVSTFFLCVALVWLIAACILVALNKKPFLGVFFVFVIAHFVMYAVMPDPLSVSDGKPLYDFELPQNFYYMLVLFFLYLVYLLLRRFYAPAKAAITTAWQSHQANRKPTKDERIAELERRLAEIERKSDAENKDESQ